MARGTVARAVLLTRTVRGAPIRLGHRQVKNHSVGEVQATAHFLVRDSQSLYMLRVGPPAYERKNFAAALSQPRNGD